MIRISRFFIFIAFFLLVCSSHAGQTPKVSCLGRIVAGERTIVVSAPDGSVVGKLLVRRGDRVARGAEIARLRDFDTAAAALESAGREIALAQAGLALIERGERPERIEAQRAVVEAREAAVRLHQSRRERHRKLHDKSIVSASSYETILYNYEEARAELLREKNVLVGMLSGRQEEIVQARARLAVAEAHYNLEQARLEGQRIRAPISGRVLAIHAYPGEAIYERGILELADTDNMMIVAEVYETDIAKVRPGSRVRFRSSVFAGEMGGEVVEIMKKVETGKIYPLDPRDYADRRIVTVRIKPDKPALLESFTNARTTVILNAP